MKKTLVLHPDNRSTRFLSEIYRDKGYTVVTRWDIGGLALMAMIETHDRILFLGHGSPCGLHGFESIFMNPKFIELLQTKDAVCIWCNSDKYVIPNNIKGFYTGMFLSEVSEAKYFNIDATQDVIDHSNELFAQEMRRCLDSDNLLTEIKDSYTGNDPVIQFNNDRLYYYDGNYDNDRLYYYDGNYDSDEWDKFQQLLNFVPL